MKKTVQPERSILSNACLIFAIGIFAFGNVCIPTVSAEEDRMPLQKISSDNEFQPIPKRHQPSIGLNSSEKVRVDSLVYKTSFEQPTRDRTTTSGLPWTYRLRNLNYEQFESKLAEIWGERLLGSALDNEQRTLRIFFPEGNHAPETSMKFDRLKGLLTFEGAPGSKGGWHKLMNFLDVIENRNSRQMVKIIDVGLVDDSNIQLVSAAFQDQDQDGESELQISADELKRLSETDIQEEAEQLRELLGNITLVPIPGTNNLAIKGDPESVARLEKFIKRLNNRSGMQRASAKAFPLQFTDPQNVIDNVQTMYDNQFSTINGPVDLLATPTGILAAGSPGALEAIGQIVRSLEGVPPTDDTDPNQALTEREKGFRTFVLRHIDAQRAETQVLTLFGQSQNINVASQNRLSQPVATRVEPLTNVLTVFGNPEQLRRAEALIKAIDVPIEPSQKSRVFRIFPVRNHRAGDFAILLQDTLTQGLQQNLGLNETQNNNIQNNNQNNQQFTGQGGATTNQPFTPFTPLRVQLNGSPSAPINFFDVRITSDAPSNTLQVVATEEAMPFIEDIIKELDRLPDLSSEVKVFQIVHGDAQQIFSTLEQIFGADQANTGQQTGSLADLPLQSPGSDGASLINIRFAVNDRTNSIIVAGSAGDIEFVEALIYRLDEKDLRDRVTHIYRLSNASVLEVSTAINDWLDERQNLIDSNPRSNSPIESARRGVIVVEEATSNSLIVTARPEYLAEIEHIINALDRRPPMVKVKAMIVQVDLNQLENFGVEFGLQDSSIFGANLSDAVGSGFIGLDQPAGQLVSDLGVGRISTAAGISGLLLSAGDDSLNFVLRFLKQKGCASILFSPQVMTLENLEGRFRQGARIQRATGSTTTGQFVQQQFNEETIGLQLGITPRVSPDGLIVMFVDVENSSLGLEADGTVVGTDQNGNAVISRPINDTVAQTTVMARSGQTVVLSGLLQEQKGQTINSVPFLGDLPVVGPLFQSVENTAERSEILIFLTPFLVDGPDDLAELNEDDFNRMHWCKCDVAELYGSTFHNGVPYHENYPKVFYPDQDPSGNNPEYDALDDDTVDQYDMENNLEPVYSDDQWRNSESAPRTREPSSDSGSTSRNQVPRHQSTRLQPVHNGDQRQYHERMDADRFLDQPPPPERFSMGERRREIVQNNRFPDPRFSERQQYPEQEPQRLTDAPIKQYHAFDASRNYPEPPRRNQSLELNGSSNGPRFRLH